MGNVSWHFPFFLLRLHYRTIPPIVLQFFIQLHPQVKAISRVVSQFEFICLKSSFFNLLRIHLKSISQKIRKTMA